MGIPVDLNEMRAISVATLAFYLYFRTTGITPNIEKRLLCIFKFEEGGSHFHPLLLTRTNWVFVLLLLLFEQKKEARTARDLSGGIGDSLLSLFFAIVEKRFFPDKITRC